MKLNLALFLLITLISCGKSGTETSQNEIDLDTPMLAQAHVMHDSLTRFIKVNGNENNNSYYGKEEDIPDDFHYMISDFNYKFPERHALSGETLGKVFKDSSEIDGFSLVRTSGGFSTYSTSERHSFERDFLDYLTSTITYKKKEAPFAELKLTIADLGYIPAWRNALEWDLLSRNKGTYGIYSVKMSTAFDSTHKVIPVDFGMPSKWFKQEGKNKAADGSEFLYHTYQTLYDDRLNFIVNANQISEDDVKKVVSKVIDWKELEAIKIRTKVVKEERKL